MLCIYFYNNFVINFSLIKLLSQKKRIPNTGNRWGNSCFLILKQKDCYTTYFDSFSSLILQLKKNRKYLFLSRVVYIHVLIMLSSKAMLYLLTRVSPLWSLLICFQNCIFNGKSCLKSRALLEKALCWPNNYLLRGLADCPTTQPFFSFCLLVNKAQRCVYISVAIAFEKKLTFFGCITLCRLYRTSVVSCCVLFLKDFKSTVWFKNKKADLGQCSMQQPFGDFGAQIFDKMSWTKSYFKNADFQY